MSAPLLWPTLSFCIGVLCSSWAPVGPLSGCLAAIVLAIALLLALRNQLRCSLEMSLLGFLLTGLSWPPLYGAAFPPFHLKNLVRQGKLDLEQPCRITGVCTRVSVRRNIGEQLELDVERLDNGFVRFDTRGRIRLALFYTQDGVPPARSLVQVGERLEVLARLKEVRNFNNPGQFDYAAFLERQDVWLTGIVKGESLITRLSPSRAQGWSRLRWALKEAVSNRLEVLFPTSGRVGGVLKALLLGDKQDLDAKTERVFQETGIYHALVVSGQHIAIVLLSLLWLFKMLRFSRVVSLGVAIAGVLIYAAIAEGQSSIARATLMGVVYLVVLLFDRDRNPLNALCLSAWILLLHNPGWLLDAGFQLSYCAVLAIVLIGLPLVLNFSQPRREALWQIKEPSFDGHFAPALADFRIGIRLAMEQFEARHPLVGPWLSHFLFLSWRRFLLRVADVLLVSFSVQVLFLALTALYFYRVSLLSIILNVLIFPIISLLVPGGFLLILISPVHSALSGVVASVCTSLTSLLLGLADLFASLGYSHFRVPPPPRWLLLTYCALLAATVMDKVRWRRRVNGVLSAACLVLVICHPFRPQVSPEHLELTMLDVRQGDSLFLSFKGEALMLVDGGGLLARSFGEDFTEQRFDIGERVVAPFLWSRGIRALDVVVLTHAHYDHMGGLPAILRDFRPRELWIGENPYTEEYVALLKLALRQGIHVRRLSQGQTQPFHGSSLAVLNPEASSGRWGRPSNDDSIAFRLQWGSRSFLLTGDIERRVEARLLSNPQMLKADVLKVSHHGSRSSSTPAFLRSVQPVLGLVSAGNPSPFGHPHPEVIARLHDAGMTVLRTDRNGAVTIHSNGSGLSLSTFLDDLPIPRP
ncbi:MAG: ComEC/Rec2 family competence protein [Acidobacteriota bacterium]